MIWNQKVRTDVCSTGLDTLYTIETLPLRALGDPEVGVSAGEQSPDQPPASMQQFPDRVCVHNEDLTKRG